ncbi:hypothetical protein Purlil1_11663 [Purpureocillium lilacinum]|uniref:Cupin type-1 domain-containing protein n=1 Tax=Purpureocillium lilacinum TaxID=33203 RepID=A0ABR0BIZ8_PURLI|nr:hypothetical protein Purlil1_11663 [Purpureocillium lilacinum]
MATSVNCYFLRPTRDAPNNQLPVLHYQNVLPKPLTEDSAKDFLTANKWEHRDGTGVKINVKAGDVIVLPAGTAHSSLKSSSDYRYLGVYPRGCPRWRNETGKKPAETFRHDIKQVGMPEADPVFGVNGPLIYLWHQKLMAKL